MKQKKMNSGEKICENYFYKFNSNYILIKFANDNNQGDEQCESSKLKKTVIEKSNQQCTNYIVIYQGWPNFLDRRPNFKKK
jgi:hypothetical protein